MTFKKLCSLLVVCAMVFALLLTGCNNTPDQPVGGNTTTTAQTGDGDNTGDGGNADGGTTDGGTTDGGNTDGGNADSTTTNQGGQNNTTATQSGGNAGGTPGGNNNTTTSTTTSSTSKVEKEEPLLPSFIRNDNGTCTDRKTGVVFIDDECASKDVGSPGCLLYDCGGKIAVDGNHRAMFNNDGNRFIRSDETSSSNWWFSYKLDAGISEAAIISYTHKNKAGEYAQPFVVSVSDRGRKWTKVEMTFDAKGDKEIGDGWIMRTYRVRNIDTKNKFLKFEFTAVDAGTAFYVPNIGRIRINNIDKMNDSDRFLEGRVAQTFYISTSGDDNNDGLSPETPWRSVDKVSGRYFQPGDKILFKSGDTFTGSFKVTGFGEANKRLTVSTYGGTKPATINTRGEGVPATMELNAEYVTVENLSLSNRLGTIGLSIGVTRAGANRGIIVQNCTFKNVNSDCNTFKYETGGILANASGTEPSWFDGMVIRNNTFDRVGRCGVFVKGSWNGRDSQSGDKYTIDGKEWTPTRNLSITGNTMTDVFGDGILVIGANKLYVEKNFINNAFCITSAKLKAARDRGENHATAALWTQNVHEAYIQYNDVGYTNLPEYGADGESFDIDALCTLHYIQYNYSHNNEGGFLLMCEADHKDVYEVVYNTKHYIRFNLSLNDASKAGQGVFMATNTLAQMNIYNNTIAKNGNSNLMNAWGAIQEYNFQNNIFYGDGCYKFNVSATCNNIKFDNNVITGGTPNGKAGLTVTNTKTQNPNFKDAAFTNPNTTTSKMADALKAFVPQTKISGATNIKDHGGKDINGTTFTTLNFYGCIKY
ncbi:MAG: hypothetical protein E7534_03245 [Ruminococcaceae bacterium]|nr:hypothetical protein [Oscillospiraceae bacterium]